VQGPNGAESTRKVAGGSGEEEEGKAAGWKFSAPMVERGKMLCVGLPPKTMDMEMFGECHFFFLGL
jgi:hypothetical protein